MDALWAVAQVMSFGSTKGYDDEGWRGRSIIYHADAAFRHLVAHLRGEDIDQESGLPALAHAAARVLMMLALSLDPQGTDRQLSRDSTKESA
jgi:hypothetical protein